MNQPVTLINAFTVPPEESERFLQRWKDNARIMAGQPGFIRARMYRSLVDDVELRFINVAEWDDKKALEDATANPEFRASVQRVLDDPDLHITLASRKEELLPVPVVSSPRTSLDVFLKQPHGALIQLRRGARGLLLGRREPPSSSRLR